MKTGRRARRRTALSAWCATLAMAGLVGATELGLVWLRVGVGRYEFTLKPWLPLRGTGAWRLGRAYPGDTYLPLAAGYFLWLNWYD